MPSFDHTQYREQLATLMAEVNAHLAALETLLTREYELLQARDARGPREGRHGAPAMHRPHPAHRGRTPRVCRAAGHSDDPSGLHSLLASCDPTGLLMPAMQEYRERTQRCRDQNDRNGFLVNGRLQQEARTYGPGSDESGGYGGKVTTRA